LIIIIKYREEQREDGLIYIISEDESVCPICIGKLKVIGSRKRVTINIIGDKEVLLIRRLQCMCCHKIHHELPDKVIPYKRHCAETVENVIARKVCGESCNFPTEYRIKKWWEAMLLYFENIIASLRIKYGATFSTEPTPREIVRAVANANLWAHTRSVMMSG